MTGDESNPDRYSCRCTRFDNLDGGPYLVDYFAVKEYQQGQKPAERLNITCTPRRITCRTCKQVAHWAPPPPEQIICEKCSKPIGKYEQACYTDLEENPFRVHRKCCVVHGKKNE